MKLTSFDHLNCSLAQTLSIIGEHWSLLVIRDAFFGLRRFDQFRKDLGISRNVLSDRLKKLVDAGVLEKAEREGHPEYRLTEKGLALQPILLSMTHWGDTYYPHPVGKRLTFVDRRDGRPIKQMAVYAADGRKLKPKDIKAKLGPALASSGPSAPSTRPLPQAAWATGEALGSARE
jgi:DNA-binding HxlR family transcriptional regulator